MNTTRNASPASGAGLTPGYSYYRHGHNYVLFPCFQCGRWRSEEVYRTRAYFKAVTYFRATETFGLPKCGHAAKVQVQRDGWEPLWANGVFLEIAPAYLLHSERRAG